MLLPSGVVFAGNGDPLLRLDELIETVSIVKRAMNAIPFRINTNGLVGQDVIDKVRV
jgi:MoaA/NifB/PqqE/SkfB family radical SAM enzyme